MCFTKFMSWVQSTDAVILAEVLWTVFSSLGSNESLDVQLQLKVYLPKSVFSPRHTFIYFFLWKHTFIYLKCTYHKGRLSLHLLKAFLFCFVRTEFAKSFLDSENKLTENLSNQILSTCHLKYLYKDKIKSQKHERSDARWNRYTVESRRPEPPEAKLAPVV